MIFAIFRPVELGISTTIIFGYIIQFFQVLNDFCLEKKTLKYVKFSVNPFNLGELHLSHRFPYSSGGLCIQLEMEHRDTEKQSIVNFKSEILFFFR